MAETYLKSLKLPNIVAISSGTEADHFRPTIGPYLNRSLGVLERHGLNEYIKPRADQLTQGRIDNNDLVVVMSEKVLSDAAKIVNLPKEKTIVWTIDDVEEGDRDEEINSGRLEEEIIYDEIIKKVDELVKSL